MNILCQKVEKKVKPSQKFQFSFDWDNSEDTSRDTNAMYQNPHEAQLLFGRRFGGGMNRNETLDIHVDCHWSEKPVEEMTP